MPVSGPASWTYTWDANGASGPNPSDGSGSWSAVNQWWNGAANQTWVDNHGVIFGVGTPGGYLGNLGGNTLYASNLTFSTSGYTLTNGALILLGAGTPIVVNAGVSATLKNALTVSVSTITLQVNSAGTLSLAGGGTFGGNLTVAGGGTLDLNAGTFGGNFALWAQSPVTQEAATLNTYRIMIGYGGNSTYTMNSPSASAASTGAGGDSFIGRGGSTGTWDLKQGTVTLTAASGGNLRVGHDGSSKGTLT